jgi:hypothetical protein
MNLQKTAQWRGGRIGHLKENISRKGTRTFILSK